MTQADEQVAEVVTYLVSAGQHVAEVSREGAGQFAGYRLAAGEYQLAIWLDDEDTSIVEWVARLTVGDTRAVWHCWVRAD